MIKYVKKLKLNIWRPLGNLDTYTPDLRKLHVPEALLINPTAHVLY